MNQTMLDNMDLALVPCALAVMIGYENHNKVAWVERMSRTAVEPEEAALALGVISDGVSASTTLASLCIALASLLGAWVSTNTTSGDASNAAAEAAKYGSLLGCFVASFACFVQSAGCYVHASFLVSAVGSDAPASHLRRAVLRGGGFWAAGLRALYLATALLVWVVFGPAVMLACSVLTVAVLCLLDSNSVPLHRHQFTPAGKQQGDVPDDGEFELISFLIS
ncbi:unnamed protein product [Urochloa decumbens]|uniref:Transmembrane protein n=1 Tax=Urochloa decumbens TaxID=240449 RepID=A0ABC9FGZ5_9POAL